MTIDGPGAKLLSISGNHVSRVFEIDNPPSSVTNSTISGLSIINGSAIFGGGGIFNNYGNPTLDSVVVSHNTAQGGVFYPGYGGGILSVGSVTITGSTISDNDAQFGGGIVMEKATLKLANSTITGNTAIAHAGGIAVDGGNTVLTNDTVAAKCSRDIGQSGDPRRARTGG